MLVTGSGGRAACTAVEVRRRVGLQSVSAGQQGGGLATGWPDPACKVCVERGEALQKLFNNCIAAIRIVRMCGDTTTEC